MAPDGSLFVADWYDPGVGGHRMEDIRRGRIFRVTPRGKIEKHYKAPAVDVTTPAGAVAALKSPNMATRYLAWTALHRLGEKAESALNDMRNSDNPVFQARAMWALGKLGLSEKEDRSRRPQRTSGEESRPACRGAAFGTAVVPSTVSGTFARCRGDQRIRRLRFGANC